eukprot:scaffold77049_cov100-Phaeocystis_antarctica.AAC.3
MAPLPHGKQIQTPINSAFGATTGRAAKKMGGLDMLEAFSMRKPHERISVTQLYIIVLIVKRSRKYTLGSRDYANTVELVFIIWASLNLRPPLPRGWELGDPVRTEDRTSGRADNFIWRPKHVLHT